MTDDLSRPPAPLVPDDIPNDKIVGALDAAEVVKAYAQRDTFRAALLVLLELTDDDRALHFLRGAAAIGELSPTFASEDEAEMHGIVMATLAKVGAEPLTEQELRSEMAAANALVRQRMAGGPPTQ